MLRSVKELHGYKILARDGEMGKVHEFLFDDEFWTIRYLVADTGSWLQQKLVLISPIALQQPDWSGRKFPVTLTKEQVENSPDIDKDKPVSRQHEIRLNRYYRWPLYWTGGGLSAAGTPGMPPPLVEDEEMAEIEQEDIEDAKDKHLRSTKEVMNYHIHARDGEIGHVEDFIVDDENWLIRYLVVDTKNWLPGRKVLVSVEWSERIDWAGALVHVDLTREQIKQSPEFDPSKPVNREYEKQLYDFYGRPKYWL